MAKKNISEKEINDFFGTDIFKNGVMLMKNRECKYCEGDEPILIIGSIYVFIDSNGNVSVYKNDDMVCEDKVKTCPKCRRKF